MSAVQKIYQDYLYDYGRTVPPRRPVHDFRREFVCPEESVRYAGSLEQLVFNKLRDHNSNSIIIEFGSGSGDPVISAILNSGFLGTVHGYEINPEATDMADRLIEEHGLVNKYIIHNISFFESRRIPPSNYLVANPPYLPCKDRKLLILPDLYGGEDGTDVSKRLLSAGYHNVFLEVSSYSNPAGLIDRARGLGYRITDFLITQMPLGIYSRQDIVQNRIREMRELGTAFFTDNCYLVGSAFFTKTADNSVPDLTAEFLNCVTALGRS